MDFGAQSGDAFLSGVLYTTCSLPIIFYTPGEGLSGITISVYKAGTSVLENRPTPGPAADIRCNSPRARMT